MRTRLILLALGLCLTLAGANAHTASGADVSKVNGSIQLSNGQAGGDLSTVNGSIRMDEQATAQELSTVNGSIKLRQDTTARSLQTVNGAIEIGERARIAGDVDAVNGAINLSRGSDVSGKLSNVNGRIELDNAHVGGSVETTAGDIEIGADSHVDGGMLVNRVSGWSWGKSNNKPPRIVIGPRAVVAGALEFRRDVELLVSETARIGSVTGATVVKFSGEKPDR